MSRDIAITGRVAAIVNEDYIALNRGSEHGVVRRMRFEVHEPDVDIIDPDNGETLGVAAPTKARVIVTEVHPRYSLATLDESDEKSERQSVMELLEEATRPRFGYSDNFLTRNFVRPTFRGDPPGRLTEEESFIKVGDPFRPTS